MEMTTYAQMHVDEALGWLPMLDYQTAVRDTTTLVVNCWDYRPDVVDAGVDQSTTATSDGGRKSVMRLAPRSGQSSQPVLPT